MMAGSGRAGFRGSHGESGYSRAQLPLPRAGPATLLETPAMRPTRCWLQAADIS